MYYRAHNNTAVSISSSKITIAHFMKNANPKLHPTKKKGTPKKSHHAIPDWVVLNHWNQASRRTKARCRKKVISLLSAAVNLFSFMPSIRSKKRKVLYHTSEHIYTM